MSREETDLEAFSDDLVRTARPTMQHEYVSLSSRSEGGAEGVANGLAALIQESAWKENSANFAVTEFSEVRQKLVKNTAFE